MVRKGFIIILIILVLLAFTSCGGLEYRYSLSENLHNKIKLFYEDDRLCLLYQEEKYICVGDTNLFDVDYPYDTDDILLSWNGHRYIWYIDEFYSNTTNNPVFIYNSRLHDVFFHEDYNYFKDVFIVEHTDIEITYEEIFKIEKSGIEYINGNVVVLESKQFPRIKIKLNLVSLEGILHVSLLGSDTAWQCSDAFSDALKENGLIE